MTKQTQLFNNCTTKIILGTNHWIMMITEIVALFVMKVSGTIWLVLARNKVPKQWKSIFRYSIVIVHEIYCNPSQWNSSFHNFIQWLLVYKFESRNAVLDYPYDWQDHVLDYDWHDQVIDYPYGTDTIVW